MVIHLPWTIKKSLMENNPLNLPEVIENPDLLKRLLAALIQEPCFNDSITVGQVKAITQYLSYSFGAGFDQGRRIMTNRVKIAQYKYGVKIREFDSLADAARAVGGDRGNIQRVATSPGDDNTHHRTHKGFQWQYVK